MHDVFDQFKQQLPDIDPTETQEWIDSLDAVVQQAGAERARYIIYKLLKRARQLQSGARPLIQTTNKRSTKVAQLEVASNLVPFENLQAEASG